MELEGGVCNQNYSWTIEPFTKTPELKSGLSQLCTQCQLILNDIPAPRWPEHVEVQTFRENDVSQPEDCHFCYLRWNLRRKRWDYNGEPALKVKTWMCEDSRFTGALIVDLHYFETSSDTGSDAKEFQYQLIPVEGVTNVNGGENWLPIPAEVGNPYHQENNSKSAATFQTISDWISQCTSNHSKCRSDAHRILPSRLIALGELGCNTIRPKLQESKHGLPLDTQYATLSHCWGGQVPLRLLKENYQSFLSGIIVSSLPNLFRDAMEVAYRLGIQYIWIDSLCIIQDSQSDWVNECAFMGQIYECGLFNIVASEAANSNGTLFHARHPLSVESCRVKARYSVTAEQEQPEMPPGSGEYFLAYFGQHFDNGSSEFISRGWIMQELMLAPRKILFGTKAVYWDCAECRATETFPKNMTSIGLEPWFYSHDPKFNQHKDLFSRWNQIVEMYARKGLTFPQKDKLAALAGIARKYGSPEDYYAGLWDHGAPLQLFWSVNHNAEATKEQEQANRPLKSSSGLTKSGYQAPSWSWASLNSSIVVLGSPDLSAQAMFSGWRAKTFLSGPDPFGPVTRGVFGLRALICKYRFEDDDDKMEKCRMGSDDFYIHFDFDQAADGHWKGRTVYCLLGLLGDSRFRIQGLTLLPTGPKGEYRRVGIWSAWSESGMPQKDEWAYGTLIQRCEVNETIYNLDENEYIDFVVLKELPFVAEDKLKHRDKPSTKQGRELAVEEKKEISLENEPKGTITGQDELDVTRESGGYRMYMIDIV